MLGAIVGFDALLDGVLLTTEKKVSLKKNMRNKNKISYRPANLSGISENAALESLDVLISYSHRRMEKNNDELFLTMAMARIAEFCIEEIAFNPAGPVIFNTKLRI